MEETGPISPWHRQANRGCQGVLELVINIYCQEGIYGLFLCVLFIALCIVLARAFVKKIEKACFFVQYSF